jgi:uncharacterized membrane protein HdeD (DUF308 family)
MPRKRRVRTTRFALAVERSIHGHWRVVVTEGVVLSLLGLAAFVVSPIAGASTTTLVGALFTIAGVAGFFGVAVAGLDAPGFIWSLWSAAVALVAGGLLLWSPFGGAETLGVVLSAFFVIDGLLTIALALSQRRGLAGRWEWMLLNGILDLFFAGLIVAGVPHHLDWALALLFGSDLLFGGGALVAMGLDARTFGRLSAQHLTSSPRLPRRS